MTQHQEMKGPRRAGATGNYDDEMKRWSLKIDLNGCWSSAICGQKTRGNVS